MAARSAPRCSTTHQCPSLQYGQHATSMAGARRMKACASSRACGLAAGIASNRRARASRSVLAPGTRHQQPAVLCTETRLNPGGREMLQQAPDERLARHGGALGARVVGAHPHGHPVADAHRVVRCVGKGTSRKRPQGRAAQPAGGTRTERRDGRYSGSMAAGKAALRGVGNSGVHPADRRREGRRHAGVHGTGPVRELKKRTLQVVHRDRRGHSLAHA